MSSLNDNIQQAFILNASSDSQQIYIGISGNFIMLLEQIHVPDTNYSTVRVKPYYVYGGFQVYNFNTFPTFSTESSRLPKYPKYIFYGNSNDNSLYNSNMIYIGQNGTPYNAKLYYPNSGFLGLLLTEFFMIEVLGPFARLVNSALSTAKNLIYPLSIGVNNKINITGTLYTGDPFVGSSSGRTDSYAILGISDTSNYYLINKNGILLLENVSFKNNDIESLYQDDSGFYVNSGSDIIQIKNNNQTVYYSNPSENYFFIGFMNEFMIFAYSEFSGNFIGISQDGSQKTSNPFDANNFPNGYDFQPTFAGNGFVFFTAKNSSDAGYIMMRAQYVNDEWLFSEIFTIPYVHSQASFLMMNDGGILFVLNGETQAVGYIVSGKQFSKNMPFIPSINSQIIKICDSCKSDEDFF